MIEGQRSAYAEADLAAVSAALPELDQINDGELRRKVKEIWVDTWRESSWPTIEEVPKNPGIPERKLVQHVRSVTLQAVALAEIAEQMHGISFDRDVLLAASLLHDVSKLVEYEKTGSSAAKSRRGQLIQHGAYGAHKAWVKGLPDEIAHIIITHTPRNSRMLPKTWEGVIVHYADYFDSDALLHDAGKTLLLDR